MKNPLTPLAAGLYRVFQQAAGDRKNQRVWKELRQLYPAKNGEVQYDNYQIKKLLAVISVFLLGFVAAICLHLSSRRGGSLAEGAQLKRKEWGAGDYQVALQATTEEWSRKIVFLVRERKLKEAEWQALTEKLHRELPELIKKDNADLQHVSGNLSLPSAVEGYPFHLTWNSSDYEKIDLRGNVAESLIPEEGETVTLTVTIAYEGWKQSFPYEIRLVPEKVSEEEKFFRQLEAQLYEADCKEETNAEITLPEQLQEKSIRWEEIKSDQSIAIVILAVLGGVLVSKAMDYDLKRKCDRRRKQLLLEYPVFISKLRLYLAAGLSVRNVFFQMAKAFEKERKKKSCLYEEIKIVCYQLENGMAEERVYQEFGKRCEEMSYRRLSFLLSVHLKQGNDQLLALLEKEAGSALEERKNAARKAGEEAGTKLLLPMTLMLIVVMLLLLLPAFVDFGTI